MKKGIKILGLFGFVFMFTSCISVFQSISLKRGNLDMEVKYSIQKALLETAASFSGEVIDYNEFLKEGDEIFGEFSALQGNVSSFESNFEIGAQLGISGDLKDIREEVKDTAPFIPLKISGGYQIRLPYLGDEEESTDDMGFAFLSGSKYRLLIDLEHDFRKIKEAQFLVGTVVVQDNTDFTYKIYGSSMLIEIPMIYLLEGGEPISIILK